MAMGAAIHAEPPMRQEVLRREAMIHHLQDTLVGDQPAAEKAEAITQLMAAEANPSARRMILDAAVQAKGLDFDALLTRILADDLDAGIRSRAATALGGLGSKKTLAALVLAAAEDPTTELRIGDIGGRSSARRDAMFAIAALVGRYPDLAESAAAELGSLKTPEEATDSQSLADARVQALYRITHNDALLRPFYDRLRSEDAATRVRGVTALQYCGLKSAPAELTATLDDESAEVRSWVALVLGRIADPATVPLLLAAAADPKRDAGLRCNAIHSLGWMRAAQATDTIRKLLTDENKAVQIQAAIALYRITGEKVAQFPQGYNAE
jgi:HEAT repeat protein